MGAFIAKNESKPSSSLPNPSDESVPPIKLSFWPHAIEKFEIYPLLFYLKKKKKCLPCPVDLELTATPNPSNNEWSSFLTESNFAAKASNSSD